MVRIMRVDMVKSFRLRKTGMTDRIASEVSGIVVRWGGVGLNIGYWVLGIGCWVLVVWGAVTGLQF